MSSTKLIDLVETERGLMATFEVVVSGVEIDVINDVIAIAQKTNLAPFANAFRGNLLIRGISFDKDEDSLRISAYIEHSDDGFAMIAINYDPSKIGRFAVYGETDFADSILGKFFDIPPVDTWGDLLPAS